MDLGKRLEVDVIAERSFSERLNTPMPTADDGWVISFDKRPDVVVLDAQLRIVEQLDLQAQSQGYCATNVAANRDGRWFGLSARGEVRVVDHTGALVYHAPHSDWQAFTGSDCLFDAQDRLWVVVPGADRDDAPYLTAIEPSSGAIVTARPLNSDIGYFRLLRTPDDDGILIDTACGQDGSLLFLAPWREEGRITVLEYPFGDRTFSGGFSPDGREFATGAHGGDRLCVHAFPGGEILATVDAETIFAADDLGGEDPDQIGYDAVFADADHLLCNTTLGRLLLIDRRTMELIGTVWPPDYMIEGYDIRGQHTTDPLEIVGYEGTLKALRPAGEGRVLAVFENGLLRLLDVYSLGSRGDGKQ